MQQFLGLVRHIVCDLPIGWVGVCAARLPVPLSIGVGVWFVNPWEGQYARTGDIGSDNFHNGLTSETLHNTLLSLLDWVWVCWSSAWRKITDFPSIRRGAVTKVGGPIGERVGRLLAKTFTHPGSHIH